MKTELLDSVESKSLKKEIPYFEIGDLVDVQCRIREGAKTRIQIFSGTVIARKGRGINETFTVRRVSGDEGVERIFPYTPPMLSMFEPFEVERRGAPSCITSGSEAAKAFDSPSATASIR